MAAAPSVTPTNAGGVEHGRVEMGGPLFWGLRFLGYAIPILALVVAFDALRRPASHFGGSSARRLMWAGPQIVLLLLLAVAWIVRLLAETSPLVSGLATALVLWMMLAAILQVADLPVVVVPRRRHPIPEEAERALRG